jgi:hypothetical protein
MATTLATLLLQADAWRVYVASSPEDQQKISETVSNIIVNFPSMGSNRLSNSALYEHDFFEWLQTTVALIKAGKWYEIDAHPPRGAQRRLSANTMRSAAISTGSCISLNGSTKQQCVLIAIVGVIRLSNIATALRRCAHALLRNHLPAMLVEECRAPVAVPYTD